jgi:SAM-dependent methyltransferase
MVLRQRLRFGLKSFSWLRVGRPAVDRSLALEEEITFWRNWFLNEGLQWKRDFQERFNPDQPIQQHLYSYIEEIHNERVTILDVGSGPITKLGKKHPGKNIVITATDLLADSYDRLLNELAIEPLVRTIYADAENLVQQFGDNAFDIVHGQNCVDHMSDPVRAIEQMVAVTKPEGFVILLHAENEGQKEGYNQLHQWDFTCKEAAFVIRYRGGREISITKRLSAAHCQVECRRDGDAILTAIRKREAVRCN